MSYQVGDADKALGLYLKGFPDQPLEEGNCGRLQRAETALGQLDTPEAHQIRGWVALDAMFIAESDSEGTKEFKKAEQAFARAYDLCKEDDIGQRAQASSAGLALPMYERLAAWQPIRHEERKNYLEMTAKFGSFLLAVNYEDAGFDRATALSFDLLKYQTIGILALHVPRGDTRKPVSNLAVPATLRQKVACMPHEARRGAKILQRNWDISLLGWHQELSWNTRARLKIDTCSDHEGRVDKVDTDIVLPIKPEHTLLNPHELQPTNFTLRALVTNQLEGAKGDRAAQEEARAAHGRIRMFLKARDITV